MSYNDVTIFDNNVILFSAENSILTWYSLVTIKNLSLCHY